MDTTINQRVAAALEEIGIHAIESEDATGFLDEVAIVDGVIHYRPDAPPSNLLHEAGHLACMPAMFRPLANGDLSAAVEAMGGEFRKRMDETGDPDDPMIRAILQCSDPEATAWAWAFGRHVGIPEETIILDGEYGGEGAGVRLQVSMRAHAGINGLRAAGMVASVRDYPRMVKWLQDAA